MVENLASSSKFSHSVQYVLHIFDTTQPAESIPLSNEDFSQFPVQVGGGGGEHVSEILKSSLHNNQPTNHPTVLTGGVPLRVNGKLLDY